MIGSADMATVSALKSVLDGFPEIDWRVARRSWLATISTGLLIALTSNLALAAGPSEGFSPDLSGYTVTDRDASYFDVVGRMKYLREAGAPLLLASMDKRAFGYSCARAKDVLVIDHYVVMPSFYGEPKAWRAAAKPFFAFEDSMSKLAAAYVATGDVSLARCIVDILHVWAQRDALFKFKFEWDDRQAWYAIEASMFAAALAYSVIRPVAGLDRERQEAIERWLVRIANKHISIKVRGDSCCNNHFYRRALYATAIGIVAGNDALFRYGIGAPYKALAELNDDGSFSREVARGSRAVHYQNYALLYLIPIMELVTRQGYPIYDLEIGGNTIHKAVAYALDVLENPSLIAAHAPEEQNLWFLDDRQYFVWMELYAARFPNERVEAFIENRRPLYNRSAGGAVTMYVYEPDRPR